MFYRDNGSPAEYAVGAPTFEDVSANAWYYRAVQWAAKRGITSEASGTFRPTGVLTQRQLHEFLVRASQSGMRLSANYL